MASNSPYDKETNALKEKLYPLISKAMKTNESKYKKCVSRFIQKRAASLYDTGPNDRIYFGKDDTDDFYKSIGVSEPQIISCLQHTFYWDIPFSPIAAKHPFTVAQMMVIRYYLLKNDQKNMELAAIYLAFSGKFYPSVHYGSFPDATPAENRAVMDYVVNSKLSNKFDLKKNQNLFGTIRSICITWLSAYKDMFKSASDSDIAYLIEQLYNRIKSFMVNIAKLYYDAYANKDYLNFENNNFDEDNYHLADSDTLRAKRYVDKAMNLFINRGINYQYCTMCADENIKKDEIKFIIESILTDKKNLDNLQELCQLLICDYMAHNTDKDIRGYKFIVYSIKAKPNVKDPNLIRIKEIVTTWLDDNSPQYRKRKSRPATANSYYKAVLQYIVLTIMESNK